MEQRKSRRVVFERGYDAHMMAIDGTWRRSCVIEEVSDTGGNSPSRVRSKGYRSRNSFCCCRPTGLAFRRCELAWVNGEKLGVTFKRPSDKKAKSPR
jgi:hypothetical protein